ncbi:hypothetical protein DDT91_17015 [Algoriphagus sp. AK58]|nr:hypothetical protein [Algoriphagus sp. AK58]
MEANPEFRLKKQSVFHEIKNLLKYHVQPKSFRLLDPRNYHFLLSVSLSIIQSDLNIAPPPSLKLFREGKETNNRSKPTLNALNPYFSLNGPEKPGKPVSLQPYQI